MSQRRNDTISEHYRKDMEGGDSNDIIPSDNRDLSPIERLFIKVENATSSEDIQGAAEIASSILCGIRDRKGNLKYYNIDPSSVEGKKEKYRDRENLYELFRAVGEAHGQSKASIDFRSQGGHCTVGEAFSIDVPYADAERAIEAVEKEGNKQDLAFAHVAMTPIMGILGSEGLVDPRRKMSIAGKVGEMMNAIDQDVEVIDILIRESEKEIKEYKKELSKDYENLENDHKELKEKGNAGI